jgi:nucleotide-binding universal stress UspA family protein
MARLSLSHDLDPSSKLVASRISRIAYPTDLSDTSDNALYRATQIAKASAADLLLLTFFPSVPLFEAEPFQKPEAERALSVLLATVKASGISARGLLLTGTDSLGKQIVRRARLERIDLIVMRTRKRSRTFRLFFGSSVAGNVVSSCSVSSFSNSLQPYKHSSPLVHG